MEYDRYVGVETEVFQLDRAEILDTPTKTVLDLEGGENALRDCSSLNTARQRIIARIIQTECSSQWLAKLGGHPSLGFCVRFLEYKNAERRAAPQ